MSTPKRFSDEGNASGETMDYIAHTGTVTRVEGRTAMVRVADREEECQDCPAARLCALSKGDTDLTPVEIPKRLSVKAGDKVEFHGTEQLHRKAIVIATVIPCILLIAVMTAVYILTGGNQLIACLCGLGTMVAFFLALWLLRNIIAHEFRFEITRIIP